MTNNDSLTDLQKLELRVAALEQQMKEQSDRIEKNKEIADQSAQQWAVTRGPRYGGGPPEHLKNED